MAHEFTDGDKARVQGAHGALREACVLVTDAMHRGDCAQTNNEVQDAIKLAESAVVLLKRTNLRI